jgi:ATP-dependent protease ClpP protease subunit
MILKLILLLLTTWIAEGSPAAVPEDTGQVKETPADQPVVSVFFLQRVNNETVGILLSEIEKMIQDHDPASINLFISSTGGNVDAAMAAYHYLRSLPVPLQTYNLATVSSSANLIYCAGDKHYSFPASKFLFHNVHSDPERSTVEELKVSTKNVVLNKKQILGVYRECMQGPEESLAELLEVGAIMLPVEAKNKGLVDEIISRRPRSAFEFVLNIKTK